MTAPDPEGLEKSPLSSKKFVAYLISEATWKLIIIIALYLGKDVMLARDDINSTPFLWWFLFCVVVVAGFIEVGYIGGQAWLDKYVRVTKITAGLRPGAKPPVIADDEPTEP